MLRVDSDTPSHHVGARAAHRGGWTRAPRRAGDNGRMPPAVRRPLIGITCRVTQARWGPWDLPAALLPRDYVDAVTRYGARTVILPPDDTDADIVDVLDGLVVAGGVDIDPARYGAERHPATEPPQPERDAGELLLVQAAAARDLPVLGICRGAQLLAVAAGGRLVQHLPDLVGSDLHRPAAGVPGWHGARFAPGSLVAAAVGETLTVNTYHHQAIVDAGTLTVTGWAEDGTVEAVEDPSRRFLLGVQWHPEATDDCRVYAALVGAARSTAREPQRVGTAG